MDTPDLFSEPPRRNKNAATLWWILAGLVLVAGAAVLYFQFFSTRAPEPAPPPVAPAPAPAPAPESFAGRDEPAVPPEVIGVLESPVDEVPPAAVPGRRRAGPRAVLRQVAARGSDSPLLDAWLRSAGIIRRLAAAVRLVAEGRSPRSVVGFIDVPGRFSVVDSWDRAARRAGRLPPGLSEDETESIFVAPEAYARYDAIAEVFAGADARAWGRGYTRVRPHFQKVFAEVARPGERFDDVLRAAIERLLRVEIPAGQAELVERGAVFLYRDAELEALGEAEKHLLRMGPQNGRAIQAFLRRFARAAGLKVRGS